MAAGNILEGKKDEDEGGNLQHPKGQQSHGIRQEELKKSGQHHGNDKERQQGPVCGWDEVLALIKNKEKDRDNRDKNID